MKGEKAVMLVLLMEGEKIVERVVPIRSYDVERIGKEHLIELSIFTRTDPLFLALTIVAA